MTETKHRWREPGAFHTQEELMERFPGSDAVGKPWAEQVMAFFRGEITSEEANWEADWNQCSWCEEPPLYWRASWSQGHGRTQPGLTMWRYCQNHYESSAMSGRETTPGHKRPERRTVKVEIEICTGCFTQPAANGECLC